MKDKKIEKGKKIILKNRVDFNVLRSIDLPLFTRSLLKSNKLKKK